MKKSSAISAGAGSYTSVYFDSGSLHHDYVVMNDLYLVFSISILCK